MKIRVIIMIVALAIIYGTFSMNVELRRELKEPSISTVYLIHPVNVTDMGGSAQIVYKINIEELKGRMFTRYGTAIFVKPINTKVYGERLMIPLFNIRLVTYGSNRVLGRGLK